MSDPAPNIEDAVELAMDGVRENHFLTTEVKRIDSLAFLLRLRGRLEELYEELAHERAKHGDG